jgi:hypothetical protein
LSELSK